VLDGTWSGVFTTQDNSFWTVEDFSCLAGCSPEGYAYLTTLLDDPANKSKALTELTGMLLPFLRAQFAAKLTPAGRAMQNAGAFAIDPTIPCRAYGFAREVSNPFPLNIRRDGENLVIEYEQWSARRTIYMDGRGHPKISTPAPLGYSIGRWEGATLVIETVGIAADVYYSFLSGGGHSDQARAIERYTVAEDPRRMNLLLTIEDPVTLTEPYVIVKTWLATPSVGLMPDSCVDTPAQR
jgi:hypothetical protein